MVSGAYIAYKKDNTVTATHPNFTELLAYMNYVAVDTATTIDTPNGIWAGTYNCSAPEAYCVRLRSGAMLITNTGMAFGGTGSTKVIIFYVDPDGLASNTTSVWFALFSSGRLTTYGLAATVDYYDDQASYASVAIPSSADTAWFTLN
jgi:hypothetical protein